MDLALYGRVIWRFKWLFLLGVLLALALTVFSVAKVDGKGHLQYRKHEVWQGEADVLLTQGGFPEGRALFPGANARRGKYQYADPGRFASLTALYAQLASSDAVRALMRKEGAPPGSSLTAAPVVPPTANSYTILPVISLFGQAPTSAGAAEATRIGRDAFIQYLEKRQRLAGIAPDARVDVKTIASAGPKLIQPRKKTLPIVVFLAALTATVALVFVLENLRPRVRAVDNEVVEPPAVSDKRRSA